MKSVLYRYCVDGQFGINNKRLRGTLLQQVLFLFLNVITLNISQLNLCFVMGIVEQGKENYNYVCRCFTNNVGLTELDQMLHLRSSVLNIYMG